GDRRSRDDLHGALWGTWIDTAVIACARVVRCRDCPVLPVCFGVGRSPVEDFAEQRDEILTMVPIADESVAPRHRALGQREPELARDDCRLLRARAARGPYLGDTLDRP